MLPSTGCSSATSISLVKKAPVGATCMSDHEGGAPVLAGPPSSAVGQEPSGVRSWLQWSPSQSLAAQLGQLLQPLLLASVYLKLSARVVQSTVHPTLLRKHLDVRMMSRLPVSCTLVLVPSALEAMSSIRHGLLVHPLDPCNCSQSAWAA